MKIFFLVKKNKSEMTDNENDKLVIDEEMVVSQKPKIYSRGAIMGFAFLCTSVFGGVLLYQNLK
ncbi:MAG TPA: hypothetical protein DCQ93_01560 [Bacteroidetes bacterium]|nr:hypothetical protein [Bacteroidota bacterium]